MSKAAAPAGGSQIGRHHFTTPEMLRTPQFYWMYVMFVLMATGGLLVTAYAGPIALATAIATRTPDAPLAVGELVSTGTLTDSQAIAPGRSWNAIVDGIDVPALTLLTVD